MTRFKPILLSVTLAVILTIADGALTKDDQCGLSKGCFSSCGSDTDCTFVVTWQAANSNATYTLSAMYQGTTTFYVALGFSTDNQMGSDYVIGCALDGNSTSTWFVAYNYDKTNSIKDKSYVSLTNSSYSNGVLTCTITRPIAQKTDNSDLSQLWTLLFVFGEPTYISTVKPGGTSFQNLNNHNGNYFISKKAVTVSTYEDVDPMDKDDPMVKAHGCLMVVAWVFFASIGIIVARFYKPVLSGNICSQKIWFQLHRFSMVLVFCITAIAFIIIFAKEQDWSTFDGESSYLQGHPIMGVMVMILTIMNPIMALFRPHPGTPKRFIFNWAHFLVGISAHILAVITIFFGIQIQGSTTPYYATYIMGAYVAWQLFIKLLLEIITRFSFFKNGHKESYELGNNTMEKSGDTEAKNGLIKNIIFIAHCVVISGLTAAIVAVIGVGYGGGD